MPNIFDDALGNLGAAGNTQAGIAQGGMPALSMNQYLNPYNQQVIGNTVGRMQDQYGQAMGGVGDAATAAGAFGGSRHGAVESQITDDYLRNVGETTASMNQQGFNTAMNAGFQDVGQQLGAASGLANTGISQYNIGDRINQNQMAAGNQQQGLAQSLLDLVNNDLNQYTGSPNTSIQTLLQALSSSPLNQNQTQATSTQPGLYDYLGLAAQTIGGSTTGGK